MLTDRMLNLVLENRRQLGRIYQHSQNRTMIGITPESDLHGVTRGTPGVKKRRKAFEQDLKSRGLGYVKQHGTYEGGHENSYLIYSRHKGAGDEALKNHAMEIGQKYGQKSILHKAPKKSAELVGTADNWVDTQGNVRKKGEADSVGSIHFNRRQKDGSKPDYRTDVGKKKYFDFS
jgi:hypothetical protein